MDQIDVYITKKCTRCLREKSLQEFHNSNRSKDGKRSECKICHGLNNKEWCIVNPHYQKQFNKNNKEYFRNHSKNWRKNNKERNKENRKKWLELNPNYRKEWSLENRDKLNKNQKNRLKVDKDFKTIRNLRRAFTRYVKKEYKTKSSFELLGCTLGDFYIWIENKFTPGMNWDNYGAWEYDHIIPCNYFSVELKNINTLVGQQMCYHYTNIQPLWKTNNAQKNDTMPPDKNFRYWIPDIGWELILYAG